MKQEPVMARYPGLTPYLCVDGVGAAIGFYGTVFGAEEQLRLPWRDGRVSHAGIVIGAALVMLCEEDPERGLLSPKAIGGTAVTLNVCVEDVDEVLARALDAGATPLQPLEHGLQGDRGGQFEDPFGHRWSIAAHRGSVPVVTARRPLELVKGVAGEPPP
ncbi:MAG: VOC family protein [Acidimicrobiia bacterium]